MNNFAVKEMYLKKHAKLPSDSFLLKISLGLILFTMASTALVYAETISVDVDGTSFDLEYDVTGMTVSGIRSDVEATTLILDVDVTAPNAQLNITLDRSFLDATFEELDDEFFVIIDGGIEAVFTETSTSESRTLSIALPIGSTEIDIIGTVFGNSATTEPEPAELEPKEPEPAELDAAAQAAADAATAQAAADAAAKATADAAQATAAQATAAQAAADTAAQAAAKTAADAAAKTAADAANTLATQCGAGTILKDGACVLDERCGSGTILQDGACVLDPKSSPPSSGGPGLAKDSVMGFAIAFLGAGAIAVVFGIIAKSQKKS